MILVFVKCQRVVLALSGSKILHTHSASAHVLTLVGLFGRDHAWHDKLIVIGQDAQPEADLLRSELTFAHGAALDEWS